MPSYTVKITITGIDGDDYYEVSQNINSRLEGWSEDTNEDGTIDSIEEEE